VGLGSDGAIRVDGRVYFPHSLGLFYQALTQYLGFPNYGDEYKVMGLAAFGSPSYLHQMQKIVKLERHGFRLNLSYFLHQVEELPTQWTDGSPTFPDLFTPSLEALLGPRRSPSDPIEQRHRDYSLIGAAMYEEAFFHLLALMHKETGTRHLALAEDVRPTPLPMVRSCAKRTTNMSMCNRQRGCRGRSGRLSPLGKAWRQTPLCHGPRLLGAPLLNGGNSKLLI